MTKDEALKQALEALKQIDEAMPFPVAKLAQKAIREALAQPEQEPVAYSYTSRITGAQGFSHHPMPRFIDADSWDIKPLYTSPSHRKPWVGLTDEEIRLLKLVCVDLVKEKGWGFLDWNWFARAIEAKLKEKNT